MTAFEFTPNERKGPDYAPQPAMLITDSADAVPAAIMATVATHVAIDFKL